MVGSFIVGGDMPMQEFSDLTNEVRKAMTKDLITKLTLSDGSTLNVYMPNMGDIEAAFNEAGTAHNLAYLMGAKATGMSLKEFRALSIVDGSAIINAINPAIDAMTSYMAGVSQALTTEDEK